MDFDYYNFYRIVGTSDQLVKNVLPLIEELSDSYRMAFFVFSNSEKSKNIGIVLAIHDHAESINSELVYAGYIFARHGIVPESCTYFEPKHPVDLSSPAAFAEDLPF